MEKSYLIILQKQGKNGGIDVKSFIFHKRFFQTIREMIDIIYKKDSEWSIKDIKRR